MIGVLIVLVHIGCVIMFQKNYKMHDAKWLFVLANKWFAAHDTQTSNNGWQEWPESHVSRYARVRPIQLFLGDHPQAVANLQSF